MSENTYIGSDAQSLLLSLLGTNAIFGSMPIGIVLRNSHGEVIDCNDQAEAIMEVSRNDLLAHTSDDPVWEVVREGGSPFPLDEQPAQMTLKTGEPCLDVVMGQTFARQSRHWLMMRTARVPLDGAEEGVISAFFDITARIRSRRILKLVAEANRIIITSKDENECLEQLCDMIVKLGGYKLAWIGTTSSARRRHYDIAFAAGATDYLQDHATSWWEYSESGATASTSTKDALYIADDLAQYPWDESQRNRASEFNLGSSLLLPLDLNGSDAILVVYDDVTFGFHQATVAGFQQIVREIKFGLAHIRSIHETQVALEELTISNDALQFAERNLAESEKWFRELLSNSNDLIIVLDEHARVLYANPANANTSGYDAETRLGGDDFAHIHPDDYDLAYAKFQEALSGNGDNEPVTIRFLKANGEWQFLECVLANCIDDPAIKGIIVNARDVTERTHLAKALRTLTNGSQVLVSAHDEASLIEEICRTIVTSGDFALAWVGLTNDSDKLVRPAGFAGRTAYLDNLLVTWDEEDTGLGPTGSAIRLGEVQVLAGISDSNWFAAGKERAEEFDLRTVCAFPLRVDGKVIGALTIFSSEEGAFDPEELSLLGELSKYLGYGIGRLRDAERLAAHTSLLSDSELRFRPAFESNMAPMSFTDPDDVTISVNDAFCRMIGYSREELLGRDSVHFTFPSDVGISEETIARLKSNVIDQARYFKRYLRKDGRVIISEVLRSPARDVSGKTLYFVSSEREVTEERALAEQLTHQALHDPLTGLANRVLFEDRLIQAHSRVERQGGFGAVLLLDLDDFSAVNDSHGHLAGDQLLVQLARRFQSVTRTSDTLGRFGGDEFLYLAEGLESASDAQAMAVRLLETLNEPFTFNEVHFEQHASAGIAIWDVTSNAPDELITSLKSMSVD